jgi:AcrR family transcriptional regulator
MGAHRDLAGSLQRAAAALIADRGPQGFSLREVARRARVSEAAPYWHFPNKEALLASVAEEGFVKLAAAMENGWQARKDAGRRLQELGVAYVRFALDHPAYLRIMFGPEIRDKERYPALKAAGARAFGLLVAAIVDGQRAGVVGPGNPEELAVGAWALMHGLSALLIDGQLKTRAPTRRDAETLAARLALLIEKPAKSSPVRRVAADARGLR